MTTRATVVGSGPNGLAAAIELAQAGYDVTVLEAADTIGGGARSSRQAPGVLQDDCSAFHPTAQLSPFFRSLPLDQHGLSWAWPEIDVAHPLDDGRAGLISREWSHTRQSLGSDGAAWQQRFEPLAAQLPRLIDDILAPALHRPQAPLAMVGFLAKAGLPATTAVRQWKDEPAKALFMGCAAHAFGRLDRPLSASIGYLLATSGHAVGWPVAVGGSQAIADALASYLTSLGGSIQTGVLVREWRQLEATDVVLLDTSVETALQLVGDRMPSSVRRGLRRHRYGPAAYKVDLAVDGPLPWTNPDCAKAGTVHLGGTAAEVAALEADTAAGRMPRRPFVLLGQQYLADPSRSHGGVNPIWAYGHVPHAHPAEAREAIIDQIERFAPGTRERIVSVATRSPSEYAEYNPNYVGGDIGSGANSMRQLVFRPRVGLNPYRLGVPGVYLCSSATAPGGGVHGMCGVHAARTALRDRAS